MGPAAGPGGAPPGGAGGGGWAGVAASLRRSGRARPSGGAGTGAIAEDGAPAGAGAGARAGGAPPPAAPLSADEAKAQARRVLAAEARKSPVDRETGKVRCLTCRRVFVSFRVLEQHLKDKHGGVNSEEAPLWAKGQAPPPAGTAGKGKGRTLSLADFAVRSPADRRPKPRVERVAVRGGAAAKPQPRELSRGGGSGRAVANPNTLSSMQTLVRRGKEREQGKKAKKPSLMKRAVQHSRSEAGLNSTRELEQRCRASVEEARRRLAEMLWCSDAGAAEVAATGPAPVGGRAASAAGAEAPPPKDSGFAWVLRRQFSAAVSQAEEQLEGAEDVLKEVTREVTLEVICEVVSDLIREVICKVELDEQGASALTEEGAPAAEDDGAESWEGGGDESTSLKEGHELRGAPTELTNFGTASATDVPRPGSSASGAEGGEGGLLPPEGEGGEASDQGEAWGAREPAWTRIQEALERKVYHCGLCGVDCSSREHFESHCNGAKHLKASRKRAHVEVVRLKRPEDKAGSLVDGREAPSRCYQGQNSDSTYAIHEVSPELNTAVKDMLSKLHSFQERLRITDPLKFKARRRLLFGLREATKAVNLGKVKSLIVAPNIEQTSAESKGRGPDDALVRILAAAEEREVPVLFALTRAKMGKIVGSRSRVSIVAVLDCSGAEQLHKQVLEMAQEMEKIDLDKRGTQRLEF